MMLFNHDIKKSRLVKQKESQMNIYLLILIRLIHVIAGILWAGTAVFYLFFIKPSVKSIGPAGPQFMQNLSQRRRLPVFMMGSSLLTVIAGGVLFWFSSGGFNAAWLKSGPGIGFTVGSIAAMIAFFVGSVVIGPTSGKMGELGQQIAATGKGPTPEQGRIMQLLEKRLSRAEKADFILLAIAMLTMATARYWIF
jgi:uncharacterized membrane protein